MTDAPTILDAMILVWLIFTWFYEGHHRKCEVSVVCKSCGLKATECCTAKENR